MSTPLSQTSWTPPRVQNLPPTFSSSPSSWKSIDPSTLGPGGCYKLLISSVTPRPVALITTASNAGVVNCAPFSYTSVISHDPPLVCHGICMNGANKKDTLVNVEENGEWVFNVLSKWYLESANHTCGAFAPEVNEMSVSGLTEMKSAIVKPPRVAQSAISFECKLYEKKEIFNDEGKHTTTLIIGRIVKFHVHEGVLADEGLGGMVCDLEKLDPVGRAGGNRYTMTKGKDEGGWVDIPRPRV